MFQFITIVEALGNTGEEVQQFPDQKMCHRVLTSFIQSLPQNSAQEHHTERGSVPEGALMLHIGGEGIEGAFN